MGRATVRSLVALPLLLITLVAKWTISAVPFLTTCWAILLGAKRVSSIRARTGSAAGLVRGPKAEAAQQRLASQQAKVGAASLVVVPARIPLAYVALDATLSRSIVVLPVGGVLVALPSVVAASRAFVAMPSVCDSPSLKRWTIANGGSVHHGWSSLRSEAENRKVPILLLLEGVPNNGKLVLPVPADLPPLRPSDWASLHVRAPALSPVLCYSAGSSSAWFLDLLGSSDISLEDRRLASHDVAAITSWQDVADAHAWLLGVQQAAVGQDVRHAFVQEFKKTQR